MTMKCEKCGGKMIQLLTSSVCEAGCSTSPTKIEAVTNACVVAPEVPVPATTDPALDVGDVVRLRSGGSLMTVSEVDYRCPVSKREGLVRCMWFEDRGSSIFGLGGSGPSLREQSFDPRLLDKVR
jgi:uncharacterized protein YodC (DUF2158 family)